MSKLDASNESKLHKNNLLRITLENRYHPSLKRFKSVPKCTFQSGVTVRIIKRAITTKSIFIINL